MIDSPQALKVNELPTHPLMILGASITIIGEPTSNFDFEFESSHFTLNLDFELLLLLLCGSQNKTYL